MPWCHHLEMTTTVREVRGRFLDLVGRPASGSDFGAAVAEAVQPLLPFEGWCLFGLNPTNGLRTFQFGGRGTEHTAEMAANEALQDDVNKYAELGRAAVPAGWLARDHPRADSSFRFNEILRPQGFQSELRILLRDGGRVWGALTLFREDRRRSFGDAEVSTAAQVCAPLARAVRYHPTRRFSAVPGPLPPGVILMREDNQFVASDEACAWLEDLVPGGLDETHIGDVTRVVFDAANVVRRRSSSPGASAAHTVVRTVSGRWLWVQGTGLGDSDVAVLLQPASVGQLLPTIARIHDLTRREAEVLQWLTAGLATKQIARELGLSPYTVNDHAKAIYRKCRVSGREELFGRLS